jgi:hypothetical protein
LAELSFREKNGFERLFGMSSGYVLDFSNKSFAQFVGEIINIDIYSGPGYETYCSKADKLRQTWTDESNVVAGKLLDSYIKKTSNDFKSKIDNIINKKSQTAHNRSVNAGIPFAAHSTHILPAMVLLRKPLFRLAKHRQQPERYTKCPFALSQLIFS